MEIPPSVMATLEKNKVGYVSVQTGSGKISTNESVEEFPVLLVLQI